MNIDGIKVTVTGDPHPGEIEGYVRRGQREHGKRLTALREPPKEDDDEQA